MTKPRGGSFPPLSEDQIQEQVRDLLKSCRYTVLCTTIRGRPQPGKGYGTDKGIPDLLITRDDWPNGFLLGVEMKGPKTPVSPAQQALNVAGRIYICRSIEDVAIAVCAADVRMGVKPNNLLRQIAAGASVVPA